jgi:hypothetical protein
MAELHGWQADPFARHEHRYFAQGQPTTLVRDHGLETCDPPLQVEGGTWPATGGAQAGAQSNGATRGASEADSTRPARPLAATARPETPTPPPGWWLASDGNWYPPELAPGVSQPSPVVERGPGAVPGNGHEPETTPAHAPAPGWWLASDGNWYPPELAPGVSQPSPVVERGPGAAPGNGHEPETTPAHAPAPGWWLASDGNWYPPELAPR